MIKKIGIGVIALLVLIQFKPVERTNPEITQDAPLRPAVKKILKRACYDCHSNETKWPWYSYVAPVSWLVTHDVNHARGHLNFSEWDQYKPKRQQRLIEEIVEEVEEGEMPLWFYLPLHANAKITEKDIVVLEKWAALGSSTKSAHEAEEK